MPHDSVMKRRGVVSGALPAGLRSSADAAAMHLGVSRTVSREAVRVLESMGLLTVRRRIGITVQPAHRWNAYDTGILRWRLAGPDSQRHLTSLNELRKGAEPRAAQSTSSQHTATLTAPAAGISAAARAGQDMALLTHRADFRPRLLTATENPPLTGLADIFVEGPISHPPLDLSAPPTATATVQRYGAVATASHADDEDAAEQGMRATRRHTARRRVRHSQTSWSATPGTGGARSRRPARPETADAVPHITETTTRTPTAGIIRDTRTRSEH